MRSLLEVGSRLETHFSLAERGSQLGGAASNDAPRKQQRSGEADAVDGDVTDLIAQAPKTLSTQLEARVRDLEASTYCTLFLPKRGRHRERNANRRQDLQRHCRKQARRGKRRFFNALLKATERILKIKMGDLSLPDEEKAEA